MCGVCGQECEGVSGVCGSEGESARCEGVCGE